MSPRILVGTLALGLVALMTDSAPQAAPLLAVSGLHLSFPAGAAGRTQVLRDSGVELPEHTFYVDNIFVYVPLPYVKTLHYLPVEFPAVAVMQYSVSSTTRYQ